MKIVVFGSTGKAGQEVVNQALERGYEVVAYARNPDKIDIQHNMLTVSKGELHDIAAIEQAIAGADAVISLLGPGGKLKDNAISEGVKNIASAMEKHGVSRILQIATTLVPDPNDKRDFKLDFMLRLVKIFQPSVYTEMIKINDAIRKPTFDWTLVRVPFLNENPLTKIVHARYKGEMKGQTSLSRADLAWFMLEQVESKEYMNKAPFISN